jgi:cyclic pyranopterin phosphate synthase
VSERLIDPFGRQITYLRLSVTEQCNLKCFYCRPEPDSNVAEMSRELLTVDEFKLIAEAAVSLGMTRIRLTGGEPLLRPDILNIVSELSAIDGLKDLSLTTNGIFMENMAFQLAGAGLKRVNISLDSLDGATYRRITRCGKLQNTIKGIEKALQANLTPVKVNVVLLKGVNEREIRNFLELTLERDIDVRFIEFMPSVGCREQWQRYFLSLDRVNEEAGRIASLIPLENEHGGPARYYRLKGAAGKIGLITPLSRHFCHLCNRFRVTSVGGLKPCLFSSDEVDLKPFISNRQELKDKFREALQLKPDPGKVACNPDQRAEQFQGIRSMTQIGG